MGESQTSLSEKDIGDAMNMWNDIVEFHDKFEIPIPDVPTFPEKEMMEFRMKFLKEELEEFERAVLDNDLTKAFDALIDLAYVTVGTARVMRLPFDKGWEVVHKANINKVRVDHEDQSHRGSKFDVIKPVGWTSPENALNVLIKADDDPYISIEVRP